MSQGFIYIAINPAFPKFLKIGKTTREPEERISELSSGTGIKKFKSNPETILVQSLTKKLW